MPTLEELRSQIADLEKQAAELHERESREAIATVVDLVRKYGLTAEQIGFAAAPRPSPRRAAAKTAAVAEGRRAGAGVPKFADPATGKTWTGFGKPPAWIAGAKDRSAFLIDASSAAPAPRKTAAGRKSGSRKAKTGGA